MLLFMFRVMEVVKYLFIINVLMYLGSMLLGDFFYGIFIDLVNERLIDFFFWGRYWLVMFFLILDYFWLF